MFLSIGDAPVVAEARAGVAYAAVACAVAAFLAVASVAELPCVEPGTVSVAGNAAAVPFADCVAPGNVAVVPFADCVAPGNAVVAPFAGCVEPDHAVAAPVVDYVVPGNAVAEVNGQHQPAGLHY